jgi:hypothetical protein
VARAEDGDICAFENRCAPAAHHLPGRQRLGEGFQCVITLRYDLRGNLRSIASPAA